LTNTNDADDDKQRWQPRPNVIFEAGMALALEEQRTILVILGKVPLPSDLHGRHFIRLDNSNRARGGFRNALVGTKCDVDMVTQDYLDLNIAGDFESCLQPPTLLEVNVLSPFRGASS
jgi:hypothetical protein